jgi:hypothetical protein
MTADSKKDTRLEALSREQEEQLAGHAARWIARALEVRPANRELAESGIRAHYRLAGKTQPKKIIWVKSPLVAVIAGVLSNCPLDLPVDINSESARESIKNGWSSYCGGQMWAAWPAAEATFYRDVCGIDLAPDAVRAAEAVTECGWWWPGTEYAVVSDRPTTLNLDGQGQPHSGTGPAIAWGDELAVYAWHGTRFPGEWLTPDGLDSAKALAESNVELRRVACEILGWDRVLAELPHRVLDADPDPEIGTLISIDLPDSPDTRYVRARCGTGRMIYYQTDSEVRTALEAVEKSYNLKPGEYAPEFRT